MRLQRVALPLLLSTVVICTFIYGFHGDYLAEKGFDLPFGSLRDRPHGKHPNYGGGVWSIEELEGLSSPLFHQKNDTTSLQRTDQIPENRLRYESSDVWRSDSTFSDQSTGSLGLSRLKPVPRDLYTSDGEFLRQTILGDFGYGANKVFYMLKTSADTQFARMPMHFMTDLTHVQNFALYSDAPGSIFGHEIVDIISLLPEDVIDSRPELDQYRSHMQSHNEHWNWDPEQISGYHGWLVDRFKNVPMLWDAYKKNPNCEWYIWVDDDSYVFYDGLVAWLETMDPKEMIYTGAADEISFQGELFNFAHGGSVVAVSRAVVEALFGPKELRKHHQTDEELLDKWHRIGLDICCGDALVAYMLLKELGVTMYTGDLEKPLWYGAPFQRESLRSVVIPPEQLCMPVVTWHHLSPHEVEVLYTYERLWKEDRPIRYEDIYRDFILPYIVKERPNWRISEAGNPIKYPEDGQSPQVVVEVDNQRYKPALVLDDCKALCSLEEKCLAWTWREEYCILQTTGITFGAAANAWNGKEGYTSGWMIERIREWRVKSSCDPLEKKEGVFNDNKETSEGWALWNLTSAENRVTSIPP